MIHVGHVVGLALSAVNLIQTREVIAKQLIQHVIRRRSHAIAPLQKAKALSDVRTIPCVSCFAVRLLTNPAKPSHEEGACLTYATSFHDLDLLDLG